MDNDHYEDFLMDLIDREVNRAAASDPGLASPKARRQYGEVIIRELPTDLTAGALRGADPANAGNLRRHKRSPAAAALQVATQVRPGLRRWFQAGQVV